MKFNPDALFPPAIIREDESVVYRRRLQEAKHRQAERDLQHEAWIENLFYGEPYRSIAEEYPWLVTR